jgi:transposase-like protein
MIDFKGVQYPKAVILHAVFFYVRYAVAVSTGERNTLVFQKRWSVRDEVSYADILHRQSEV